jgi:putative hydrolase of the HAD superfamily
MSLRFIFFDLGNVLFRFSIDVMLKQSTAILGCTNAELRQFLYGDGIADKLETGVMTEVEFFEVICERFGVCPNRVELSNALNDIFTEIVEIRPFLEHLVAINFPRGILSNTSSGHWNHVSSKFSYLTRLIPDNHVLSFKVGSMKPNRAIFEYAMTTAQKALKNENELKANEILFIDDLKQNIEGASNFGFDTIQFLNWQHVNDELKKRNFNTTKKL